MRGASAGCAERQYNILEAEGMIGPWPTNGALSNQGSKSSSALQNVEDGPEH